MATQNTGVKSSTRPWTLEERELLNQIYSLIKRRSDGGYPDLASDCGMEVETDGEVLRVVPAEDFVNQLLEELDEIIENGPSMLSYCIAEASNDVPGMMGLKAEAAT